MTGPVTGAGQSDHVTQRTTEGNVTTDAFLTLLIAQLRSQNPLEPMNPNEFVAQLAQFNSLSQLIEIRQLLEQSAAATAKSDDTGKSAGGIG